MKKLSDNVEVYQQENGDAYQVVVKVTQEVKRTARLNLKITEQFDRGENISTKPAESQKSFTIPPNQLRQRTTPHHQPKPEPPPRTLFPVSPVTPIPQNTRNPTEQHANTPPKIFQQLPIKRSSIFDTILRVVYFCAILAIVIGITKIIYTKYYNDETHRTIHQEKPLSITYQGSHLGITYKEPGKTDYPLDFPHSTGVSKQKDGMKSEVARIAGLKDEPSKRTDYPIGFPKSQKQQKDVDRKTALRIEGPKEPRKEAAKKVDYPVGFPTEAKSQQGEGQYLLYSMEHLVQLFKRPKDESGEKIDYPVGFPKYSLEYYEQKKSSSSLKIPEAAQNRPPIKMQRISDQSKTLRSPAQKLDYPVGFPVQDILLKKVKEEGNYLEQYYPEFLRKLLHGEKIESGDKVNYPVGFPITREQKRSASNAGQMKINTKGPGQKVDYPVGFPVQDISLKKEEVKYSDFYYPEFLKKLLNRQMKEPENKVDYPVGFPISSGPKKSASSSVKSPVQKLDYPVIPPIQNRPSQIPLGEVKYEVKKNPFDAPKFSPGSAKQQNDEAKKKINFFFDFPKVQPKLSEEEKKSTDTRVAIKPNDSWLSKYYKKSKN